MVYLDGDSLVSFQMDSLFHFCIRTSESVTITWGGRDTFAKNFAKGVTAHNFDAISGFVVDLSGPDGLE